MCKFGEACYKADCIFKHPEGRMPMVQLKGFASAKRSPEGCEAPACRAEGAETDEGAPGLQQQCRTSSAPVAVPNLKLLARGSGS
eukprot:16435875-Heterocapsa_arctica.AAC.1